MSAPSVPEIPFGNIIHVSINPSVVTPFAHRVPVDADEYFAAQHGGWTVQGIVALEIEAESSAALVAAPPAGTALIELSFRGGDVMIRFDNGTPSASAGHLYRNNATYRIPFNAEQTKKVKIFNLSALAPCNLYATFWGTAVPGVPKDE